MESPHKDSKPDVRVCVAFFMWGFHLKAFDQVTFFHCLGLLFVIKTPHYSLINIW